MNNDFGYLIIISKSQTHRYDLMAVLLAQSIKRTQKQGYDKIALVTDDQDKLSWFKGMPYFDSVIFWDKKSHWDGRSYMDELSPWKFTVCLDTDMIFFRDTSHWVDYFIRENYLYVANKVLQYNGELMTNDHCRKTFTDNNLPMLYSGYTFFAKNEKSKDFFDLGRTIIENPKEFKNFFLYNNIPEVVGTDEAFALAAKILDIDNDISYPLEFPRFTHLKSILQDGVTGTIKDDLGYYFNEKIFKIGIFNQIDILHYSDKDIDISTLIQSYQDEFLKNMKVSHE